MPPKKFIHVYVFFWLLSNDHIFRFHASVALNLEFVSICKGRRRGRAKGKLHGARGLSKALASIRKGHNLVRVENSIPIEAVQG